MIKVLVNGALGRMGRTVVAAVNADSELELVGAVDAYEGEVDGMKVETNLDSALKRLTPDVMVDFTRPNVVFDNVMTALANKVSPVVGTTGERHARVYRAELCIGRGADDVDGATNREIHARR